LRAGPARGCGNGCARDGGGGNGCARNGGGDGCGDWDC